MCFSLRCSNQWLASFQMATSTHFSILRVTLILFLQFCRVRASLAHSSTSSSFVSSYSHPRSPEHSDLTALCSLAWPKSMVSLSASHQKVNQRKSSGIWSDDENSISRSSHFHYLHLSKCKISHYLLIPAMDTTLQDLKYTTICFSNSVMDRITAYLQASSMMID